MSEEEQAEAAESESETADAAEHADADEEEAADESEGGIENGDFVRLEYTVRTVGDDDEEGRVVDTTSQEIAEEAGIDDDEYDFSPRTIVVGEGHVFDSVDEDLVGTQVGDTNTVTVPADEGFGEFDPDEVRTVAADKIPEDDRYPGAQVTIDGDQGYVEAVIGGRARVDFNHPLAGDELEYEYEVLDLVDDREEQAQGLIGMYLQEVPDVRIESETVEEEVTVEPDDGETPEESREAGEAGDDEDAEPATETQETERESLYIEATPMMQMNQQWMFSKQQIAEDVMDRLDLDRVVIEEVIEGGGGMMGGMGGMMGGMGGGMGGEEMEEALDDVDVDADELVEELEDDEE